MAILTLSFVLLLILQTITAPPVAQNKEKPPEEESDIGGLEDYMEYHRYLKEVVNALESDPEFRSKLEKAEESDIRSGKIAEELEFVSHHVRTRLDEIKRVELERLKELKEKQLQLMNGDYNHLEDPNHGHLDHSNPHTFEIEDLKKLIAKTTEDLAAADRRRREEFKQYELQKEYEKQAKLNHTNGTEREKLEKEYKEREEKHKKHEKLHEPGHKAQLEEVWEEQDQMQQEFDPKTFFMLHDLDSNGLWDQDEVKALFVKELEKMYKAGEPEDDMRERAEEMERMRETVFNEVDVNRDGFIDYDEFLAQTKRSDFQQDHGWQGLDERKPYTDEELQEYIRQHEFQQAQFAQQQGHYPPNVQYQVPPGGYHPNAVPPQAQYHAGQVPQQQQQQYHGQMPPPHQGAAGQPQQYHGQVPQPQFQPGQLPQNPPQQLPGNLNTNEVHSQHQQQQQQPQYQQQQQQPQYQQQQQQPQYQQQQQQPQYQQQQQPQPPPQQHPNVQYNQANNQQNQPPNIENAPNHQQENNQQPPPAASHSQNQINQV